MYYCPSEVQAKKVFTAEEKAMRRAEMARRRRNLSEKRNEEVKVRRHTNILRVQACDPRWLMCLSRSN